MNKIKLVFFLFYFLCILVPLHPEITTTLTSKTLSEIEKCQKFQIQLYGSNLDPQRALAFTSALALDIIINKQFSNILKSYFYTKEELDQNTINNTTDFNALKETTKNLWHSPKNSTTNLIKLMPKIIKHNSYEIKNFLGLKLSVAILMHKKLLKKYKINAFTSFIMSTNPIGLVLYILCNHYFLGKALIKIVQNYNPDEIPLCIKPELDAAIKLWEKQKTRKKMDFHKYAMLALNIFEKLENTISTSNK